MPYKNFKDVDKYTLIFVLVISFLSGLITFLKRKKDQYGIKRLIIVLLIDTLSSLLIGTIVYIGLLGYGTNNFLAAGISGMLAHQGTRAVFLIELAIAEKIGSQSAKDEIKKEMEANNV